MTKEVTEGPWPKPSAGKMKCVTSSTNLNQFNFFESNDTSKPPPAASKHSYPDAAFAYFGNPELFDPAAVGTSKWPPDPGGELQETSTPRRGRDLGVAARPGGSRDLRVGS